MNYVPLSMTRGSDFERTLTFDAALGDMTGWTFEVIDVVPAAMAGEITCTLISGPARTALIEAPWGPNWPAAGNQKYVSFYVRPSGLDESLLQFRITLK